MNIINSSNNISYIFMYYYKLTNIIIYIIENISIISVLSHVFWSTQFYTFVTLFAQQFSPILPLRVKVGKIFPVHVTHVFPRFPFFPHLPKTCAHAMSTSTFFWWRKKKTNTHKKITLIYHGKQ
jgi:hypothetical protein